MLIVVLQGVNWVIGNRAVADLLKALDLAEEQNVPALVDSISRIRDKLNALDD